MARITRFTTHSGGTARFTVQNLPTGQAVTKAWLTVKADLADADPGLVQLTITTTPSASGAIEAAGLGPSTDAVLRFDLSEANTDAIGANTDRWYDVKVLTDGPATGVVQFGIWTQSAGVTTANS